jgi:hypothetical protein
MARNSSRPLNNDYGRLEKKLSAFVAVIGGQNSFLANLTELQLGMTDL